MSTASELCHNYKLIHDRLVSPSNAIKDKGINLKRKPPEATVLEYPSCKVTIQVIPRPPMEPVEPRIVKLSSIMKAICRHYNTNMQAIRGPSRTNRDVLPRHLICYLGWLHTELSMPQISRAIGRKDHTTVLHARDKMKEIVLVDDILAGTIKLIENELFAGYYDDDFPHASLAAISQQAMAKQG